MSPLPDSVPGAAGRPLRRDPQATFGQSEAPTSEVEDHQWLSDSQDKAVLTNIFKQNIELRERMINP